MVQKHTGSFLFGIQDSVQMRKTIIVDELSLCHTVSNFEYVPAQSGSHIDLVIIISTLNVV